MRYFFLPYTKYACEKLPFFDEKSQAESSPLICSVLPWEGCPKNGRLFTEISRFPRNLHYNVEETKMPKPASAEIERGTEETSMAHTVLIVEDDPNIADLLHLYLEKDG